MDFHAAFADCIRKGDVSGIGSLCIDKSTVDQQFVCQTIVPQFPGQFSLPQIHYPTPVIYAILCRQKLVLRELLQFHPNLDIPILNWFPIHYAVAIRANDIVRELLSHDPSQINKLTLKTQNSPLHIAVSTGDFQLVLLLLLYNANVDSFNSAGLCPTHSACFLPTTEILEALFAFGANMHVLTGIGEELIDFTENKFLNTAKAFLINLSNGTIKLPSRDELIAKISIQNDDESANISEKADLLEQRISAAEELIEYQKSQK